MQNIQSVGISSIDANPWQPRKEFRGDGINDLASSIKRYGILQPLVVVAQSNGRFRLIAGERRLRAAREAGLREVPVVVRVASDEESLEIALVENVQREDLNAVERARGYEQLIKRFNLTQEQVAKRVGKSRAVIANALRLLGLPEAIQNAIREGKLSEGHAKVIAGLDGRDQQLRFFERVVQVGASVRETEAAAKQLTKRRPVVVKAHVRDAGHYETERRSLEQALGTKVEITRQGDGGTITVHFYSTEELGEVVRKIAPREP